MSDTGHLSFPLRIDGSGRTARAGDDAHVRELIELVLLTEPGERVMRPDFGCGLRALVFAPMDDVLAAATQTLVHAQLRQWLDDVVSIDAVTVEARNDASLAVTIGYHLRGGAQARHRVMVQP